ncbi:hypothetical protein HMPREF1981_02473 [Bacteroides pyogenes F0041]|uniref:Uncharacterized protein n=1 Tax=Bacteroides pyogenes F0041 TaxID=1321819 RepID=U2C124_9BACE|nr:hypothetical protein HMPREF1981_02473 [Bacteroides pyogenes F0041]
MFPQKHGDGFPFPVLQIIYQKSTTFALSNLPRHKIALPLFKKD